MSIEYLFARVNLVYLFIVILILTSCNNNIEGIQTKELMTPELVESMPTPTVTNTLQAEIALATATDLPIVTATSEPSPTHTPTFTATPSTTPIPCDSASMLPTEAFPAQVDMERSRIAVANPYLFLAVEQYIGLFDISDPPLPVFLGFWEFPALPEISALVVRNDIVFAASGSSLEILNLASQCRLASLTRIELPFQIFRLQLEGDRLYVGGNSAADEPLNVAILSIARPLEAEILNMVELEPAVWSVHDERLYSHVLGDVERILVTDLAEPTSPRTEPVNINIGPELLLRSLTRFVENKLYLLSDRDEFTMVEDLQAEVPVVWFFTEVYLFIAVFQVEDDYVFLGSNWCDAGCSSILWILDAVNGTELSSLALHPHHPVWRYVEIQQDIIYAFAEDTLLVIDISDLDQSMFIGEVPLFP
jgi:hypothetical protein